MCVITCHVLTRLDWMVSAYMKTSLTQNISLQQNTFIKAKPKSTPEQIKFTNTCI